ncbi:MAG: beta galactosidase jelly roll domain-containing protein, partial [Clostridia bacterium]|nr:beta galactosidase jelly roll domain-containing protein [Clostridia bacterium]
EAGDRTPAYYAVRDLIAKYTGEKQELTAKESEKRAYGKVTFTQKAELFDNLDNIGEKRLSVLPLSMEECGQNYGYILYKTKLWANASTEFRIMDLRDRANVFIDKQPFAVMERSCPHPLYKAVTEKESELSILVENMGRINYGSYVMDSKGIAGVKLWEVQLFHWENICLPMNNLERLVYKSLDGASKTPAFYRGTVQVDAPCDTFIKPTGFSKGFILINGFNIGRYYNEVGPQKTLYVPKCYLKEGENEIVIFDSDGAKEIFAEFVAVPQL